MALAKSAVTTESHVRRSIVGRKYLLKGPQWALCMNLSNALCFPQYPSVCADCATSAVCAHLGRLRRRHRCNCWGGAGVRHRHFAWLFAHYCSPWVCGRINRVQPCWKPGVWKSSSPDKSGWPRGTTLLQCICHMWGNCLRGSDSQPGKGGPVTKLSKCG